MSHSERNKDKRSARKKGCFSMVIFAREFPSPTHTHTHAHRQTRSSPENFLHTFPFDGSASSSSFKQKMIFTVHYQCTHFTTGSTGTRRNLHIRMWKGKSDGRKPGGRFLASCNPPAWSTKSSVLSFRFNCRSSKSISRALLEHRWAEKVLKILPIPHPLILIDIVSVCKSFRKAKSNKNCFFDIVMLMGVGWGLSRWINWQLNDLPYP